MKTRVYLKYFVSDYRWKQFLQFLLAPVPFKLDFVHSFCNSKAFHTVLT